MKVSIIIPTLNEEKAIKKTLEALASIKNIEREIIVADDNSTDNTRKIAEAYAKVISPGSDKKDTIADTRNRGAANARGEFLAFLDADVYVPDADHFFSEAIKEFENDPKLVGLVPKIKIFPEVATFADRFMYIIVNFMFYLQNNILSMGAASGEFQMVKREAFEKIHGYDKTLPVSEDNDLFYRLSKIGKTKLIKKLYILHSSRRAHQIGWSKLLYLWMMDYFSWKFFKRTYSKEWKVIR